MKQTAFETNLHAAPASQEKNDFPPKAALRESEAVPLECLEAAGIGSYVVDLIEDACNSSAVLNSLLGIPQQEKHPLEIWPSTIHPQWREQFMRAHDDAMKKGERFDQEYKIIRQDDGRERWVHDVGSFESNDQGRPVRMIGAIRDITERKLNEEALRQSVLRLRSITDSTMDAVVMIDPDGTISFWNPAAESIFGYRLEEVLGQDLHCLLAPEKYHQAYRDAFPAFQSTGKGNAVEKTLELSALCKDGREKMVSLSLSALSLGGRWHAVGIARDITERKRMEQEQEKLQVQLLQAQKMEAVGILASGVAHDFNNLLQTMSGTIELMRRNVLHDHPDADRLRILAKSVDRGAQLVRQLLQFSRKTETRKEWMDMNREIDHVVVLLKHVIPRMINVGMRLAEKIWPVNADRTQVEQMLLNLANNAVDAMPDGGRLTIATQNVMIDEAHALGLPGVQPGPHVLLTVADTGCGMDKETLEHVFDPFFTTKGVGKGSGLGLATTFGIISGHGGHVACSSEPGLGTTFKIHLPAAPDREAVQDVPEQAAPDCPEGDETILVADDEPDIRELTQEALESLGYTVIAVKNGEAALIAYEEKKMAIRLVILDLGMPGMGGRGCLRELRRIDPGVKVLVASGYHETGLVDDVLKNGAAGFIHKPYQIRDLAVRVRDVLDHDRQEDGEEKAAT